MEFSYQKVQQDDVTLLHIQPMPDWQDFELFVQHFLQMEQGVLISQDQGMDRHQIRYRIGNQRFLLQFEHYTESVWIEVDF